MPDIQNIAPSKNWFDGRTFLAQARELMERQVKPEDLWKRPAQLEVAILSISRGIWTLFGRHPEDGSLNINELAGKHMEAHHAEKYVDWIGKRLPESFVAAAIGLADQSALDLLGSRFRSGSQFASSSGAVELRVDSTRG